MTENERLLLLRLAEMVRQLNDEWKDPTPLSSGVLSDMERLVGMIQQESR